ncbi:MAG TPA: aldehyde dehydrogenase family protein, partial [Mycobacteriales bacterium]|nr:aldehyde dehydrogenase family protein [Mycobacteriales bacterium]
GETFQSVDPASGEPVGTFPVHSEADVQAAVARARPAAAWWAGLGFAGRADRLGAWRAALAGRAAELAELIHREGGKPVDDAMIELATAIEHLHWAPRNAERVLGARRVRPGLLVANLAATLEYQPYGVVGVIGPWNYPVFTPLGSIVYALAAGNAVVFKPSEYTPAVGRWLADSFAAVVPEQPVFGLVTGAGPTGAALCRSGVDKLAFTGSTATAKKIMAACAETLTPVLLECGGKDAMIVAADADVRAAADAAAWGGMANAGQTCIGIERVYAVESVYDEFVAALADRARTLRPGTAYGPATMPAQLDVIRRHVTDALARGGRAVVGGAESVRPPYAYPTVLVDVPEDAAAVREETFGPTLTVTRVADVDEAVEKANASRYGLGAAVFARTGGEQIARRIRSGMTSVNSVLSYAGVGALPFGGVGDSGFGRIHGDDGLREFARAKAITRPRFRAPLDVTRFDRRPWSIRALGLVVRAAYGRAPRSRRGQP